MTQPIANVGLAQEAPATPRRVADLIEALSSASAAAASSPLGEDLTVTVSNRKVRVELHAWSEEAGQSLAIVNGLMRDPVATAERMPYGVVGRVAKALRRHLEEALPAGELRLVGSDEGDRVISLPIIEALRGFERLHDQRTVLRGSTVLLTPVLRVGRSPSGSARWAARVRVYGKLAELPLLDAAAARAIRALERKTDVEACVHAVWTRYGDGGWELDARASQIVEVRESGYRPLAPGEWSTLPSSMSASRVGALLNEEADEWAE